MILLKKLLSWRYDILTPSNVQLGQICGLSSVNRHQYLCQNFRVELEG